MLILEVLVSLHRTVQAQLLQRYSRGIDLDYRGVEWFALEMNSDHSVISEITSNYCISDFLVDNGHSISKGFLPTVVDIMVI